MVEATARLRHIRITPQKARRVVNLIRGKQANEALGILKFAPQVLRSRSTNSSRRQWPTLESRLTLTTSR